MDSRRPIDEPYTGLLDRFWQMRTNKMYELTAHDNAIPTQISSIQPLMLKTVQIPSVLDQR